MFKQCLAATVLLAFFIFFSCSPDHTEGEIEVDEEELLCEEQFKNIDRSVELIPISSDEFSALNIKAPYPVLEFNWEYQYDVLYDPETGLYWQRSQIGNFMDYLHAENYCDVRGFRLPTISELRTLVVGCPHNETGGACRVSDQCNSIFCYNPFSCRDCPFDQGPVNGCYWRFGLGKCDNHFSFWSSTAVGGNEYYHWTLFVPCGRLFPWSMIHETSAFCVYGP